MLDKILNLLMYPIRAYNEWQYKKYKKEFFTKKAMTESKKFNQYAKRIR